MEAELPTYGVIVGAQQHQIHRQNRMPGFGINNEICKWANALKPLKFTNRSDISGFAFFVFLT